MAKVPVRKGGKIVAHATIDDADAFLLRWRWHLNNKGYVKRTTKANGRKVTVYLHRAVMALELNGSAAALTVDHKNGLALDCTRANLVVLPRSENTAKGNRDRRRRQPPIPV